MKIMIIGSLNLTYGLWWKEYNVANGVFGETEKTIDGSLIIFEQPNRVSAQNITAESREDGWQNKEMKEAIVALANSSMGKDITVTLSNGNVIKARFAYEVSGGAVQFEPIYDGATWFKGVVHMAKV